MYNFCVLSGTMLGASFDKNKTYFVHQPNLRDLARDIVSIGDCICEQTHPNGIACKWAGALQRIALMHVQQGLPITQTRGKTYMREVKLSGITMGGTGHGSKLNTHIAYLPVIKQDEGDAPLSDPNFPYFDGYLVEFIDNKIANGEPIVTTKIRHDSCVAYDGCVVLVHEARLGSDEEQMTKLLIGLCRMLPYSTDPYGCYSTAGLAYFVKVELNVVSGEIEYCKCLIVHNTTDSVDMARKVTNILTLIKHIAGILAIKESSIDDYKRDTQGTRDNPQKKKRVV